MRLSLSLWVGVVVLLTAATSVPQPTAAAVAPWQELLSLDCAGNIRAFASNPILATAIDASLAHSSGTHAAQGAGTGTAGRRAE
jgi:hypothetical protein